MAHRKFSGTSWGDVFHEIAEWAYAHQRSEDYRVANLPKETLPGDDWTLLNSIVLDVSPDDEVGDDEHNRYHALLYSG